MYISRLSFHTLPGKTDIVERELHKLVKLTAASGVKNCKILRTHFASLGAADVVFEQEAQDLSGLEGQLRKVTESPIFQKWTKQMSKNLSQSPKREVYLVVDSK